MKKVQVAIIGGGPAGMAAAIDLAKANVDLILLDAYPQLGGHYFKQPPVEWSTPKPDARQNEFRKLVDEIDARSVPILHEAAVWGIFREDDGFTIHLQGPKIPNAIHAQILLVTTGAYDRPLTFPGWHLPGVITLGGAQMLLKGHGILPGKRILVAGGGPLLLAAAAGLVNAGGEVVAVLDVAAARDGLTKAPAAFWGQGARIRDAIGYMRPLLQNRVPIRFRHTIFRALGDDEVTGAVCGQIDGEGHPRYDTAQKVDVDTICVALGFLPNLAITRHLGCDHVYDAALDAFYPQHSAAMETSVANVFVAGDITRIGGKDMAKLQGQLAAIHILQRLESLSPAQVSEHVRALQPTIQKEERFLMMIADRLRYLPGLLDLVDDETVVCRCEMVSAGQINAAIADGARDLRSVKLRTRCGMGACQSRYCEPTARGLVAHATGQSAAEAGVPSIRPPIVPVLARDI